MAETTLIQDRYRLLDLIGRGGSGEVWRARDEALERCVAVKRFKPLGPGDDPAVLRALRARFRREARVAAALQHRGVTVVHDFGAYDGVLYLVMELLEGHNLSELLKLSQRRPFSVPELVDIGAQLADALAYTHDQGVVHRDLKPANIMRLAGGTVKICDFGIARIGDDMGFTARLNGGGVAMGTPHYMSPEQIGDSAVDYRSDLYSLGCVLYELATGAPPFDLDDSWSILLGHRDTPPRPPRTRRPDLPEDIQQLILHLLAKRPGDRPRDAGEVLRRLTTDRSAPSPPYVPAQRQPAPPPLPTWSRGIRTGCRAGGRPPRARTAPADRAGLTRPWTGPHRRERALGADHPDILAARQETARALGWLGRHADAHQVCAAVLAARLRLQGPDHPDTLATRCQVAWELGRLGRWSEALRAYREVADARGRVLGPEHPETLTACFHIGVCLGQLGRWPEAAEVHRSVAEARSRVLGAGHPATLASRSEERHCLAQGGAPVGADGPYPGYGGSRG